MIESAIIGIITIMLAYLSRYKGFKYGLELAFLVLTSFVAIRYNWGNDYSGYLEDFHISNSYSVRSDAYINTHAELGWIFLNRLFKPIGFFGFTIVITIFEYFVIYRLVKQYVPKDWYWLSLFVFIFNADFMLITSSMMRQFLAMTVVLVAIDFIIKKKWYISLLLIYIASLFHTSALIFLPLSFIGFINYRLSLMSVIILFGSYMFLYFFSEVLFENTLLKLLQFDQLKRYQGYVSYEPLNNGGTGMGVIFFTILLFILLLNQKNQSPAIRLVFILYFLSYYFYTFGTIAPLIGRLGYYFSILQIVAFPCLFKTMKKNIWYYALLAGIIIINIKGFFVFFDPADIWRRWFYNYQTIFSSPFWM